jgi:uncharacterized membrane protein YedE/YeeE
VTEQTQKPDAPELPPDPMPYSSPYLAGLGLGLTLLLAYWILGTGLGASSGIARISAWAEACVLPQRAAASAYFGEWLKPGEGHVLSYYLTYMVLGAFVGGLISALACRRLWLSVERGPRSSVLGRLLGALIGGVLVGFASRLARGCTSGQALSGTAMLFTGSVVFLLCLFAGAYAAAFFVRRQWI